MSFVKRQSPTATHRGKIDYWGKKSLFIVITVAFEFEFTIL